MTLPLFLAPEAEEDLHTTARWYESRRPGLGDAFLGAVDVCFARIQELPMSFPAAERGFRSALLRRFPYAVHFRVDDHRIEVIAVWHGRRSVGGWLGRLPEDRS